MLGRTNAGFGSSLAYYLESGTTRPATAKENTVWIDSAVTATELLIQPTEPASPTHGMVWLYFPGIGSVKCRQYVSNAWVLKSAWLYANEAWSRMAYAFDGVLYDAGAEATDFTGGWVAFNPDNAASGSATGCTKNADNLSVSIYTTEGWPTGGWTTTNEIDFSEFTTLHIIVTHAVITGTNVGTDSWIRFGATQTKVGKISTVQPYAALSSGELSLNISTLERGYPWFGGSSRAGRAELNVSKMWLT